MPHPPADLEVVLPIGLTPADFLKIAVIPQDCNFHPPAATIFHRV